MVASIPKAVDQRGDNLGRGRRARIPALRQQRSIAGSESEVFSTHSENLPSSASLDTETVVQAPSVPILIEARSLTRFTLGPTAEPRTGVCEAECCSGCGGIIGGDAGDPRRRWLTPPGSYQLPGELPASRSKIGSEIV